MGTGVVTVIPKGKECDVEWKMNFASLVMDIDVGFDSPDFSYEGASWQLMMWMNDSKDSSARCFDMSLSKHFSKGPPIDMEISFSLKSVNGKKRFRRQNRAVFEGSGSMEVVPMFLSKSDFKKKQFEFLSSGYLTVVCTLKKLNSGSASGSTAAQCGVYKTTAIHCGECNKSFSAEEYSSHEKKCRVKCPECSSVVSLRKWHDHKCQISTTKECSYCKRNVDGEDISTHKKKCMDRPIKCPECSEVVLLLKWHDHECHAAGVEGKTNASRSSKNRHHDKFLQDFKQVLLNQENCDVVLRVKGREFQAHKVILAARSPVFESTFRNDMKEKETGIVDIEDCDPSIFPDFLSFLYSDDVDSLSEENVYGLFTAADKYDIPVLRKLCLEFLKENLCVEIFCETLTLALKHSETELIHLVTDFFIKNADKILVTVKWLSFAAENPTQSNELVIKLVTSYKCSKS